MKTLDEVIAVMDHVEFCCTNCKLQFDCDEVECFLEDAFHYLKEYQTIKQKTGKWISIDSNTVNGKCSECGYESHLYENDVYGEHYCPNCGVKMELK